MLHPIVGRDRELSLLRAAFDDASPNASATVLVGPAGAGKTTLWTAALSFARELGLRVLEARPTAAEARLTYGSLDDLLATVDEVAWARLPAPQRRAFDIALLREEPRGEHVEPRAIAVGLAGLLRAVASDDPPLVIAIDDTQWLDPPTAAALAHALRRLDDAPIRLVACARVEADRDLPDVIRATSAWSTSEIGVGPLSVGAIFEVLRLRAGIRLPRPVLIRVHTASGGNPFFALEIAGAIAGHDLRPGSPLPLPHSLDDATRRRLVRLSPSARAVLLAASALADPSLASVLAASDDEASATRGLDEAAEGGIIELDGDRLRFCHPLLASAAYSMASPAARRRAHRRLADIVGDPEERARHLALWVTGPSVRVAAALDRGADRAHARGAPDAAAELAERALDVTPPGRWHDRHVRRLRSARAHFEAGDPARAIHLLSAGLPVPDGRSGDGASEEEAEILVAIAEIEVPASGVPEGLERYDRALRKTLDDRLRARIHADLASAFADAFELRLAREHANLAVEAAERLDDRVLLLRALAIAAYVATITGSDETDDLLARAITLEHQDEAAREPRSARFVAAIRALYEDRIEDARRALETLAGEAEEAGAPTTQTFLAYLSLVERRAGRFDSALRYADAARDVALQTGRDSTVPLALHLRAQALAHLGDVSGARRTAEEVQRFAAATGQQYRLGLVDQGMLGFLALSLGDFEGAADLLDPAADLLAALDPGEPSLFTFLPDAIEAAIDLRRPERAELLLARLEGPAIRLGRGWALMAAARCRGLLATSLGDDGSATAAFERSLAIHGQLPSERPFELGRTLLGLGALQRRRQAKSRARATLGAARRLFAETGARLWVARADAEMARIGGRRASGAGLTEVERRIADLVATGQTNKEIGGALAISPKTVAWNLTKVYAKLGVESRTELVGRMRPMVPSDR